MAGGIPVADAAADPEPVGRPACAEPQAGKFGCECSEPFSKSDSRVMPYEH